MLISEDEWYNVTGDMIQIKIMMLVVIALIMMMWVETNDYVSKKNEYDDDNNDSHDEYDKGDSDDDDNIAYKYTLNPIKYTNDLTFKPFE